MNRDDDLRTAAPTFHAMRGHDMWTLAAWWGDRTRWPLPRPGFTDVNQDVRELSVMSALGQCLRDQVPSQIHRALLHGACVGEVCEATGLNSAGVMVTWTEWAIGQRDLYRETGPGPWAMGIPPADYEHVMSAITGRPTAP